MLRETLHNETAILKKIASGDEAAFRILFGHYSGMLYAFAVKILHDDATAEELVQEVFIKVWLHRDQLAELHNFPSWLFVLAKNLTLNYLKNRIRQRRLLAEITVSQQPVFSEDVIQHRDYESLLVEAIGKLPPRQKLIYTLSREQGLQREEIARRLNLSPETIKAHLARATRFVRAYMIKCDEIGIASLIILFFLVLHFF